MEKEQFGNPEQDQNKEILKAPKGWRTDHSLSIMLQIDKTTIKKITAPYRESNPDYFAVYGNSMGTPIEHFAPALVETITQEVNKTKEAPEEYYSEYTLASSLGVDFDLVPILVEKYRKTNPEYFVEFKDGFHYSPRLRKVLHEKLLTIKEAPMGWELPQTAADSLGISLEIFKELAKNHYKNNTEYVDVFINRTWKPELDDYYSPEIIELIKGDITRIEKAPEGWKTGEMVSEYLGHSSSNFIKRKAHGDYRRLHHPEYFALFKNEAGKVDEYYSPELVNLLTEGRIRSSNSEKRIDAPYAPEGWLTNGQISDELNVNPRLTSKIADDYRTSHEDYFKDYKSKNENIYTYYSPVLIEIIKEKVTQQKDAVPEAPENWKSIKDISETTGISSEEVKRIAEKLRQKHKDKFGKFKNKE